MLRSLYTAATGMEAQELKMDVVANNLANASTTGFKKVRAEFADLLADTVKVPGAPLAEGGTSPSPLQVGLGVATEATSRDFTLGDIVSTGNSLDLAIEGDGFFRVIRANGELAYTRAGNLRLDADGRLVTQRGELLEPEISVPPETVELKIEKNGKVFAQIAGEQKLREIGQIELATFVNPNGLVSIGGNLFEATEAAGDPIYVVPGEQASGTIAQGFLEGSNVQAVEEMIAMIATQRAYELNSKVIQTADAMLQRLSQLK